MSDQKTVICSCCDEPWKGPMHPHWINGCPRFTEHATALSGIDFASIELRLARQIDKAEEVPSFEMHETISIPGPTKAEVRATLGRLVGALSANEQPGVCITAGCGRKLPRLALPGQEGVCGHCLADAADALAAKPKPLVGSFDRMRAAADDIATGPHGWVQWKGTDVCIDIHCECGHHSHVDAWFAYRVRCPQCQKVWHVSPWVRLVPWVEGDSTTCIKDPLPEEGKI